FWSRVFTVERYDGEFGSKCVEGGLRVLTDLHSCLRACLPCGDVAGFGLEAASLVRAPAVDRVSCCSAHWFDALAERALEAGCDPCWRLAYQVCPDYCCGCGL